MSLVPDHPLPIRDVIKVADGLTIREGNALIIASIDATLARIAYAEAPSIDTAIEIAAADIALVSTFAKIKGITQ